MELGTCVLTLFNQTIDSKSFEFISRCKWYLFKYEFICIYIKTIFFMTFLKHMIKHWTMWHDFSAFFGQFVIFISSNSVTKWECLWNNYEQSLQAWLWKSKNVFLVGLLWRDKIMCIFFIMTHVLFRRNSMSVVPYYSVS